MLNCFQGLRIISRFRCKFSGEQRVTSPMFIMSAHHSGAIRLNNFNRTVAASSLEWDSGEWLWVRDILTFISWLIVQTRDCRLVILLIRVIVSLQHLAKCSDHVPPLGSSVQQTFYGHVLIISANKGCIFPRLFVWSVRNVLYVHKSFFGGKK